MEWLKQGALPVGMLMFAITTGGFLLRRTGYHVARKSYPKLAEHLGLSYKPSRYASGVGTIAGLLSGRRVVIDPDDQRHLRVAFLHPPGLELWMHAHNRRAPPGMESFRPRSHAAASLFQTAHGTPDAICRFNESDPWIELGPRLRRIRALKGLSVTGAGITLSFDFGSPPYIPADLVRELVPELLRVAETLEPRT